MEFCVHQVFTKLDLIKGLFEEYIEQVWKQIDIIVNNRTETFI